MWSYKFLRFPASLFVALGLTTASLRADNPDDPYSRCLKFQTSGSGDTALSEAQKCETAIAARDGTESGNYGATITNLASILQQQGRYVEAESYFKRAVEIGEKLLGGTRPEYAQALNNLALLYDDEGRYSDAEPLYRRALGIFENAFGPNHPAVAETLYYLSWLYYEQGRYAEAEPLDKQALALDEKFFGSDSQHVAGTLNTLATLYTAEGRFTEAEPLFKRELAIAETAGPNTPAVVAALNNLASFYDLQGRLSEAEPLKRQVVALDEAIHGPDSLEVAKALNNLAALYDRQRRASDAEPLYRRALAIGERILDRDDLNLAPALDNLGAFYRNQGRYAEAEPLFKSALAAEEKALGPRHPDVARSLDNLALLYVNQGRYADGLSFARRSTSAVLEYASIEGAFKETSRHGADLVAQQAALFNDHLLALASAFRAGLGTEADLGGEAFVMGQWSVQSSAANALQEMAARTAAGTGPLAALVRQSQDLTTKVKLLDKKLVLAMSTHQARKDQISTDALRKNLEEAEHQMAETTARLAEEFPDYESLTKPQPLKIGEVQKLLGPDEALVFWVLCHDESHVFGLTHDDFQWRTIKAGRKELTDTIAAFRRGLSVDELNRTVTASQTSALFDIGRAHALYETLLGPVDALIKDKRQLLVVPSGPLTGLPVHLLVTEKPAVALPDVTNLDAYRAARWLMKRQAVSVLPAVASLKALRSSRGAVSSAKPLTGFGNPAFQSGPAPQANPSRSFVAMTRSYSNFWEGADVNRDALSRELPALPGTATELNAVARDVGASPADVHLGANASESKVKALPLADFRIVYFATHALVAGDIKGLGEPALALTLPKTPNADDDGLLTASEVAALKLDADWVVLSACNTAAGDKPGAEALSGLARSFFYAGARALLVSHWDVGSDAATRLMTSTFDIMKSDPQVGKSEALRRAMLAYLNDKSDPWSAHPAFWGPFSLVGDGKR